MAPSMRMHFQQTFGEQRLEDLVPELGAVGAPGNGHQLDDFAFNQALTQHFDLVPT
jgi:hypothetical protein